MNNKLYHHGIKGQRWGVRRFQNEDGSLTSAGRSRYLDGSGNLTKQGARMIGKAHNKKYMDEAGNLTKRGAKAANKDNAFSAAVKQASFERKVSKDWTKSYNRAADEFESTLDKLTKKYDGVRANSPEGKKYAKEVGEAWQKVYSKQLVKDFGKEPITNGTDWVKSAPFMDDVMSTFYSKEKG